MSHWGFNLSPIFYCVICLFVRASLEAQLVKDLPANAGDTRDVGLIPGSGRFPGEGNTGNTPVVLPGKFHGQRSLTGYSPCGRKESDMTEHTCLVFLLLKELFILFTISPLSEMSFANIFSLSIGWLFTFLIVSFYVQKCLI